MSKKELNAYEDFEAFYERHWKYVFRLCFTYMNNIADAEDCAQDVFVKVLKNHYQFKDNMHERKWLTITSMNLCINKLNSYYHRNIVSVEDDGIPELVTPETTDYSDVLEAVIHLPPKLKEVIWLYYYEGYSTKEIAVLLNRPPSTIRNQMRDARNLLKTVLEER
ncbi:MAG: RNA polymerase sigma factor [Lachnospiraceae bacterium]|nr:RNA polymerase sigma factor [Lachnospiraceae bacterium]